VATVIKKAPRKSATKRKKVSFYYIIVHFLLTSHKTTFQTKCLLSALAAWSSGIVSACPRANGSRDRILPGIFLIIAIF
jgi:hypothetical protein